MKSHTLKYVILVGATALILFVFLYHYYYCALMSKLIAQVHPLFKMDASHSNEESKYLLFTPHSGYSNQVISLKNALMLANLLNRTLIMPPFLLGSRAKVSWQPGIHCWANYKQILEDEALKQQTLNNFKGDEHEIKMDYLNKLLNLDKQKGNCSHCGPDKCDGLLSLYHRRARYGIRDKQGSLNENRLTNPNTLKYIWNWELVNPEDLFLQLKDLKQHGINYIYARDFDMKRIHNYNSIFLPSKRPYEYSYWDNMNITTLSSFCLSTKKLPKMDFCLWKRVFFNDEKSLECIHTLKSTPTTIRTERRNSSQIHIQELKEKTHNYPFLIVDSLFAADKLSLTLPENKEVFNLIQASFFKVLDPSLVSITEKIVQRIGGKRTYLSLHLRATESQFSGTASVHLNEIIANLTKPENLAKAQEHLEDLYKEETLSTKNQSKDWPLYVATDVQNFKETKYYKALKIRFDKIYILNDFQSIFEKENQISLCKIKTLCYPFLDQMVAAQSAFFVGTRGSTFTGIIRTFYKALLSLV